MCSVISWVTFEWALMDSKMEAKRCRPCVAHCLLHVFRVSPVTEKTKKQSCCPFLQRENHYPHYRALAHWDEPKWLHNSEVRWGGSENHIPGLPRVNIILVPAENLSCFPAWQGRTFCTGLWTTCSPADDRFPPHAGPSQP